MDSSIKQTVFWPRSHKEIYDELIDAYITSGKSGWIGHYLDASVLRAEMKDRYLEEARRITVPAGSLIVWNSKLIHQVCKA